jgi:FKBP-type peptidyl-prolyl cis-trans isomerase
VPTVASNSVVTATGAFGKAPTVTIPAKAAANSLYTKTVIQGTGAPLTTSQTLLGNFVLYDWSGATHKLLGSTYSSGTPTLFSGQMLTGLQKALIGQKEGSRVLAVIPPSDGFGSAGNSSIGVGATDTLVFVVDMDKAFDNSVTVPGKQTSNGGSPLPTVTSTPGKSPVVTEIPNAAPPKTLQVKTLIKGTGAKVASSDFIIVQYYGVVWKNGAKTPSPFQVSWPASGTGPFGTPIGVGQVVKGWDTGLVGQTVGSRVLLVIPPADGYGSTAEGSIPANSTLVFVVDIIADEGK